MNSRSTSSQFADDDALELPTIVIIAPLAAERANDDVAVRSVRERRCAVHREGADGGFAADREPVVTLEARCVVHDERAGSVELADPGFVVYVDEELLSVSVP